MSHRGMDDQMTLRKFPRIFLQTPSNRTAIYHSRTWEDFLKSALFSPLTTHISHNGSGYKQVDPLKTLYKRDLILSSYVTFYYSSTHCLCVLKRKTDLTVKGPWLVHLSHPWQSFSFSSDHQTVIVTRNI